MGEYEFKYTVSPGKAFPQSIGFMDRPMSFEKDEITLRNKFKYD